MNVDDLFRAKYFAAKASDAVLAKLDGWQLICGAQVGKILRVGDRLHVDNIGGANDIADPAAGAFFNVDAFDHERISTGVFASIIADLRRRREFAR
jgi:hypothetical protein